MSSAEQRTRAEIVVDSIAPNGVRLTTLEVTFPRVILAELNTHRAFSRNSASSRARSVTKTIAEVESDPYVPSAWPTERRGMSGGEPLGLFDRLNTEATWRYAAQRAVETAQDLVAQGVHKSIVNRLLEPFMWHTAVITATDWENFFDQRLALLDDGAPAADIPMFELAQAMKTALELSAPKQLDVGEWHLPYVTAHDQFELNQSVGGAPNFTGACHVSVARCAGVSYLTQGTEGRDLEKDLALYHRLRTASPPHWSPFEHVATPLLSEFEHAYNLRGWASLRWLEERELRGHATLRSES